MPYFQTGGAEKMAAMIASNLDLTRFIVTVICVNGKQQNTTCEETIYSRGIPIFYINKGLGFSFTAVCKLWALLNQVKPDIVHTHLAACLYTAPWILFHPVMMIHTIHTIPQYEGIIYRRIILFFLFQMNKAVPIALSQKNKTMISRYFRISEQKIEIIHNPVEINKFQLGKRNTLDQKKIRFINVGRLTKQKNQKFLLNVFKKLHDQFPDVSLLVVGEGPERENLEKFVSQSNLDADVVFTGNVENIEDYLTTADIFVLTSICEGLPLSMIEAMASGLPIIASDVGGISDIVKENGILVPSNDEKALWNAMTLLISNSIEREKMGMNSKTISNRFDISVIIKEYEKIFQKYAK